MVGTAQGRGHTREPWFVLGALVPSQETWFYPRNPGSVLKLCFCPGNPSSVLGTLV